jgi:antitoxin component YwqK of YwqJK toxin-antitoxin module
MSTLKSVTVEWSTNTVTLSSSKENVAEIDELLKKNALVLEQFGRKRYCPGVHTVSCFADDFLKFDVSDHDCEYQKIGGGSTFSEKDPNEDIARMLSRTSSWVKRMNNVTQEMKESYKTSNLRKNLESSMVINGDISSDSSNEAEQPPISSDGSSSVQEGTQDQPPVSSSDNTSPIQEGNPDQSPDSSSENPSVVQEETTDQKPDPSSDNLSSTLDPNSDQQSDSPSDASSTNPDPNSDSNNASTIQEGNQDEPPISSDGSSLVQEGNPDQQSDSSSDNPPTNQEGNSDSPSDTPSSNFDPNSDQQPDSSSGNSSTIQEGTQDQPQISSSDGSSGNLLSLELLLEKNKRDQMCGQTTDIFPTVNFIFDLNPETKKIDIVLKNGQPLFSYSVLPDGSLHGQFEEHYQTNDGSKKIRTKAHYKKGIHHGTFESHYPNGNPKEKSTYQNGIHHGPYKKYLEDGSLQVDGNYKEGKEHGTWLAYYPSGILDTLQQYKDGKKFGYYRKYEDGTCSLLEDEDEMASD